MKQSTFRSVCLCELHTPFQRSRDVGDKWDESDALSVLEQLHNPVWEWNCEDGYETEMKVRPENDGEVGAVNDYADKLLMDVWFDMFSKPLKLLMKFTDAVGTAEHGSRDWGVFDYNTALKMVICLLAMLITKRKTVRSVRSLFDNGAFLSFVVKL